MSHHINEEGQFQSDKYPWLTPDMIILSPRSDERANFVMGYPLFITKAILEFSLLEHRRLLRLYCRGCKDIRLTADILTRIEALEGRESGQ